MSTEFDRRQALRLSAGALAAVGLVGATATPAAAKSATAAMEDTEPLVVGGNTLPAVPGMLGDRRANELWFEYDNRLLFQAPPELLAAYGAVQTVFAEIEEGVAFYWLAQRQSGNYPHDYIETWRPLRDALVLISRSQLAIIDKFYGRNYPGLLSAFLDFGQGVLFDPRRPEFMRAHIMNGNPPAGYHVWHAYIRAMVFLDVDANRWDWIDRYVGATWHVQSLARPLGSQVNPPLDPAVIREITRTWLPRTTEQIEAAFESIPFPAEVG